MRSGGKQRALAVGKPVGDDFNAAALIAPDDLNGAQRGHWRAHAKGILLTGNFAPSLEGVLLTRPELYVASRHGANGRPS